MLSQIKISLNVGVSYVEPKVKGKNNAFSFLIPTGQKYKRKF